MKLVWTRAVAAVCTVLVVLSLAACQTKSGAAAVVGGQRISEGDLDGYVGNAATEVLLSRQFALTYLVKAALYERVLSEHGGVPADTVLAGYHDTAIAQILSNQLGSGAAADALIAKVLVARGVSADLVPVVERAVELEWATYQRLKVAAAQFLPTVAAFRIPVSISPRYGAWDKASQDLVNPVTPSFLTVAPTPSASAATP